MAIIKMKDLDLQGKKVFIRADLNVPIKEGQITSDARIKAVLPTLQLALEKGAKILLTSHLSRPKAGKFEEIYSLKPVVDYLNKHLSISVRLVRDYLEGVEFNTEPEILVLENVRFNVGEKKNDPELSKKYANLCDVFVMDAFGTAHRAEASTAGIAEFAKVACAGPLLTAELEALGKALKEPARPMLAIVGGSKVSSKLEVLENLAQKADQIIVGGGIANTFIASQGFAVGSSLYEADLIEKAKEISAKTQIPLPSDVKVATEFSETAQGEIKSVTEVKENEQILDIGEQTARDLAELILQAKTILWNGPVGVFEFENFKQGTEVIGKAIAKATENGAFSIAGGGDTLAAIDMLSIQNKISYISTGGGAFLEFVEGKTLPAVAVLEARGNK